MIDVRNPIPKLALAKPDCLKASKNSPATPSALWADSSPTCACSYGSAPRERPQ